MIVSYDIDGVLAEGPPPSEKKWGRMNGYERNQRKEFLVEWYRNASPLLVPSEEKFYAVSARKNDSYVYTATQMWLDKHYPNRVIELFLMRDARTVVNAANFKSSVLASKNVQIHYEDNKKVLKLMKQNNPDIKYFFWEKGMSEPEIF